MDAAHEALSSLRLSIDGERPMSPNPTHESSHPPSMVNGLNGKARHSEDFEDMDRVENLRFELERAREEKETLAVKYRSLVAKLETMRTALGNKLKQDAEELDRREQAIQQLTAQNEDMNETIQTLQTEILTSNAEAERYSQELKNMRSQMMEESAEESSVRDRHLRETQFELERCRMEREEWERATLEERVLLDEARSTTNTLTRELEMERDTRLRQERELEIEKEKSTNLQSVLEDFQSSKDHELRQAVREYETQLTRTTQSLAEFKSRALIAELQLEETASSSKRTEELSKEVKEKNLLIGKLRHEAVIMNEHLTEALRRLRKNSQENNVDRRLVTNILLQFITTPRADSKRFEMLNLLATILSWNDAEREKAGLQRSGSVQPSSIWGRSSTSLSKTKGADLEKTDETESFSQMWVEFLLREAASGTTSPTSSSHSPSRSNLSLPGTPTSASGSPGAQRTMRLPSFTSVAMASSPTLSSPPPRRTLRRETPPQLV